MPAQHLNAPVISEANLTVYLFHLIEEINRSLETSETRHDQFLILGHISAILTEVLSEEIGTFTSPLTDRPIVQGFFRSGHEGNALFDEGLVLSLNLGNGTGNTAGIASPGELLRRGGWDGGDVTVSNVLDGVAGVLSDAAQTVLDAFLRTGEVEPSGDMISLSEVIGSASCIREEAEYAEHGDALTDDEYARAMEVPVKDIDTAIQKVIESPLGVWAAGRLHHVVDNMFMGALEALSSEISLLRVATLKVAIGDTSVLDTLPSGN